MALKFNIRISLQEFEIESYRAQSTQGNAWTYNVAPSVRIPCRAAVKMALRSACSKYIYLIGRSNRLVRSFTPRKQNKNQGKSELMNDLPSGKPL